MLCVRRWSYVWPEGRVRCWQVQCWELKTGQQKVQLYHEDDPLCPSRYIIYLWHQATVQGEAAAHQQENQFNMYEKTLLYFKFLSWKDYAFHVYMYSATGFSTSDFFDNRICQGCWATVQNEMKCSSETEILHKLVYDSSRISYDTTQINLWFSDFCVVSWTNSWSILVSKLRIFSTIDSIKAVEQHCPKWN